MGQDKTTEIIVMALSAIKQYCNEKHYDTAVLILIELPLESHPDIYMHDDCNIKVTHDNSIVDMMEKPVVMIYNGQIIRHSSGEKVNIRKHNNNYYY